MVHPLSVYYPDLPARVFVYMSSNLFGIAAEVFRYIVDF